MRGRLTKPVKRDARILTDYPELAELTLDLLCRDGDPMEMSMSGWR